MQSSYDYNGNRLSRDEGNTSNNFTLRVTFENRPHDSYCECNWKEFSSIRSSLNTLLLELSVYVNSFIIWLRKSRARAHKFALQWKYNNDDKLNLPSPISHILVIIIKCLCIVWPLHGLFCCCIAQKWSKQCQVREILLCSVPFFELILRVKFHFAMISSVLLKRIRRHSLYYCLLQAPC